MFAQLSEYLDSELTPEMCDEFESHLTGCAPCIEFIDTLKRTIELCRHYRPTELPSPIAEAARQQLREAWRRTRS
jgi:anti-sigma factor RsiW